jgi:hypothetical protein
VPEVLAATHGLAHGCPMLAPPQFVFIRKGHDGVRWLTF